MEDLDIIEERDGYRVRIQLDTDAERPYDEGACPILQVIMQPYEGYRATAFNDAARPFELTFERFSTAHSRKGPWKVTETFERYLRIFHGTKNFATYHLGYSREYGYIAFDTKAWLEEIGVTEENPDIEPVDRAEPCLDEIRAWAEGDVYGWIVEKEVFWTKTFHDANGEPLNEGGDVEDDESGSDWIETESCWGFYGRDYAEQAAKEALETELENN